METGRKKDVVLVVGGSGYLGLHVLEALAASPSDYTIAFTYQSHPPSPELLQKLPNVLVFELDLCSGIGLAEISKALDNVSHHAHTYTLCLSRSLSASFSFCSLTLSRIGGRSWFLI